MLEPSNPLRGMELNLDNIVPTTSINYLYHCSLNTEPDVRSDEFVVAPQRSLSLHAEPAVQDFKVITSLIDSLTVPAAAEPESSEYSGEHILRIQSQRSGRRTLSTSLNLDQIDQDLHDPVPVDDSNKGEVAAAPVIGYARRPPVLPKRKSKPRFYSLNMSQSTLAHRESMQSLKSRTESDSIGIPSIGRRHGSSASSTFSLISGLSAPPRKETTEQMRENEKALSKPIPPKRFSSDRRRKTAPLCGPDQEKENTYADRHTSLDGFSSSSTQSGKPTDESPTVTPLTRVSRSDLGNHMIPSRRSSLRRSATGLSDTSHESVRHSMTVGNLKDLAIDSELIDGDSSTVRRIRELQEAREKRQKEWRHEARKSERAAKRHTIAGPKMSRRSSSYLSSSLSVAEVVTESPEAESPVELSACLTADDLASMPALVSDSLKLDSPVQQAGTTIMTITPPGSASAAPSRASSFKQSPSDQSRRKSPLTSSRQGPSSAEFKSISDEIDAFLGAPRLTQKIRHPRTGRTIAFSEVGDPQGFVVFCCVGMGLTRYLTAFYDELARTMRLRLVTPDRPGVGESSSAPEASCTPLNWVDDVAVICSSLGITRFSLLAHSAGAIYALATALKMPQYVRGRIHLLAPWIPPSQMPKGAALGPESQPVANLPLSHKILSVLPPQFLKVANSRFLTATSASIETKPLKSAKRNKHLQVLELSLAYSSTEMNEDSPSFDKTFGEMDVERPPTATWNRGRSMTYSEAMNDSVKTGMSMASVEASSPSLSPNKQKYTSGAAASPRLTVEARQAFYNQILTHRIWALATQNANPAIDLVVCLERRKPIGFRYPEVTRSVVIHHGAKDTRVPLDNVRWLQSVMKRCELRVLDDEGHGLMASASAMATVLGEISKEWEEWEKIAVSKERQKKKDAAAAAAADSSTSRRGWS
ncbi:hypothetical protein ABEF95_011350 [Exophiala dermatitidis]